MTVQQNDRAGLLKNEAGHEDLERVHLQSLAKEAGFPAEFIKKELLLKDDDLSIEDLRESVLTYLETVFMEREKTEQ